MRSHLAGKLKTARDRKQATGVKVEGCKSHREQRPEAVKDTLRLQRAGFSYDKISAKLAEKGHLNKWGKPCNAKSVCEMVPRAETIKIETISATRRQFPEAMIPAF